MSEVWGAAYGNHSTRRRGPRHSPEGGQPTTAFGSRHDARPEDSEAAVLKRLGSREQPAVDEKGWRARHARTNARVEVPSYRGGVGTAREATLDSFARVIDEELRRAT